MIPTCAAVSLSLKQTDNFEQFGGWIGGPIKKNKLFYFGAFDGMRYTVGEGAFANVPTTALVPGNPGSVPYAIDDMLANGMTPSPLSLKLADCTVAGVTATCGNKGVFWNNAVTANGQLLPVPGNNIGHSNNGIGKIDFHPNDKNSINGEYFLGQAVTTTPNTGEAAFWSNLNLSRTQMMRAVWDYTPNATWVNDLRFGYNRYNLEDGNSECSAQVGQPNYAADGFISGATPPTPFCGFPYVNFGGAAGYAGMGANPYPPGISDQGVLQYTYTAYDNVSYAHGKHDFKFGFEFHHTFFHGVGAPGPLPGVLNYNDGVVSGQLTTTPCPATLALGCEDLQNFLAGNIQSGNILANPQQEDSSLGFNRYAFYITDDFRASSRLTVNLGLRYELEPAWMVDNNNAGNFAPYSATGMVQQQGIPLYQPDYLTLAPRAGIAWDITGKGTTVLRAGMGISYDTPQVDDLIAFGFGAGLNSVPTGFNLYNSTGLAFAGSASPQAVRSAQLNPAGVGMNWAPNVPVFNVTPADFACGPSGTAATLPDGVPPSPCTLKAKGTVIPGGPNGALSMNTQFARSPMYTWTLGIQHAFTGNTSLMVNYVGTHADNLASEININQPTPGATATAALRQPYFSQYPWFNGIFVYTPAGFSNYNALQATLVQRNFHGLTANVAYTFSRDLATPKGGNNPYIMDSSCVGCDYGLRTPTQDLGITLVYALPGRKAPGQMLRVGKSRAR